MVNTIEYAGYNVKEREHLYKIFLSLKAQAKALTEEIYAIEDDDELEKREPEVGEMSERVIKAYMACFAAQFHSCQNEWFKRVVDKLPAEKWQYITEKQYFCFVRYASDTDNNHWRDGKSYCRVGDYLVTLVWHNGLRAIKKEYISLQ